MARPCGGCGYRASIAQALIALATLAGSGAPAVAAPPSLSDSFRLGSGGGVLCRAQSRSSDAAIRSIFDRAWSIVYRDAAQPVGAIRALRGGDAESRLSVIRATTADCVAETEAAGIDGLAGATLRRCRLRVANVGYVVYTVRRGAILYLAEGLEGYASALDLGLRTVLVDRMVPGKITVATSAVADPVAFARVPAGTLDPDRALAEGYRRNNSGDYAEAAEFFDTLQQRTLGVEAAKTGEYLINRALQKSNLGDFAEADALLSQASRFWTASLTFG
jgi:hypothetical protein